MTLNPNQFSFSHLNDEDLYKAHSSVLRRINNLEARHGGVIELDNSTSGGWGAKKQKLVAEQDAIRQEMQSR